MDAVKELIASMKDSFRERLSNPLLGAFIFAWLAWNARLLMVVVGEGAWVDKLDYVDKKLYPDWWAWSTHAAIFPLISAIAFILIFPFVNRWVLVFSRQQQKLTYEKILKIDEEVPLTR